MLRGPGRADAPRSGDGAHAAVVVPRSERGGAAEGTSGGPRHGVGRLTPLRAVALTVLASLAWLVWTVRVEDIAAGEGRAFFRNSRCHPPGQMDGCSAVVVADKTDVVYALERIGKQPTRLARECYANWLARFDAMRASRGGQNYVVHPYWYALKDNMVTYSRCSPGEMLCIPANPFKAQQIGRAVTFLKAVRADPRRDGFKVEKDKCLMTEWIARSGLPQPRSVGPWRQLPATVAVLREIADGKMPGKEPPLRYPVFLKACHITQGAQHGTRIVMSQADLQDNFARHAEWVRTIWNTTSADPERPWQAEASVLYPMVAKGIMVVEGWQHSAPPPAELKIEVMWGAAYLGFWLGNDPFSGRNLGSGVDRECRTIGAVDAGQNTAWFCRVAAGVFDLAERAAASLGADEVRIDVFVHPTDPSGHAINEISLFSGHPGYLQHKTLMGKAWRYGYTHPEVVTVADDHGGEIPQPYKKWQ